MTLIWRVWVSGTPKGQPRPRAFSRGGKARVFDPGTAEGWKSSIAVAFRLLLEQHPPIVGPVRLELDCHFDRPKSHRRASFDLKPTAPWYHTSKPDADNVAKAVLDALTTLGIWHDDAQVAELLVVKQYAGQPGSKTVMLPGCEIRVYALFELSPLDNTLPA